MPSARGAAVNKQSSLFGKKLVETDNAQCVSFKKNYVIDNLQKVLGAKENNEIRRC